MIDPISISAVSLIIGGGIGAILGRLTSGATEWQRKFITMKLRFTNAAEDAFLLGRQCKELDAALGVYEAAEAKRQAQRKAAAKKAGERSHRDRLAREAEAAAKTTALHETMSQNMGDTLRARAAAPEGAEPDKPSRASPASLSQGAQ